MKAALEIGGKKKAFEITALEIGKKKIKRAHATPAAAMFTALRSEKALCCPSEDINDNIEGRSLLLVTHYVLLIIAQVTPDAPLSRSKSQNDYKI